MKTRTKLRSRSLSLILLAGAATVAALGSTATIRAATITWATAQNISADSNVLNSGITVGAFRLGITGLTAATVNGVTFQPIAFADNSNTAVTIGNFTINPNFSLSSNTGFGTTSGAYGQLPAATQNLLQSGSFSQNDQINLTMNGLTVGQVYTFEWWGNNAGNFTGYGGERDRAYSGTAATGTFGQALANSTGNTSTLGGVGQFVTGTFTADATSQSVLFTTLGQDAVELNAFQLRTVPEPSTWAMMFAGAGLLGFATLRRRAVRA